MLPDWGRTDQIVLSETTISLALSVGDENCFPLMLIPTAAVAGRVTSTSQYRWLSERTRAGLGLWLPILQTAASVLKKLEP